MRAVCPAHVLNCVTLIKYTEEYNLWSCHFAIISVLLFGPYLQLKILFPYSVSPLGPVMTSNEARMTVLHSSSSLFLFIFKTNSFSILHVLSLELWQMTEIYAWDDLSCTLLAYLRLCNYLLVWRSTNIVKNVYLRDATSTGIP